MGDYDFILDGIVWSYSNLKSFETCPYSWYKKYIMNDEHREGNIYGDFGTFCHSLLEGYERGDYHKEKLAEIYEDEFFDNVNTLSMLGKKDPTDKLYDYGYTYFENVNIDLSTMKPLMIEENVEFKLDDYKFRGIIDLLYQDEQGNIVILDHKTSEYPLSKSGKIKKSKVEMMEGYTRQLSLYALGILSLKKYKPKYIGWNFIREGKIYIIPLTEEMLADAKNWAISIIKDIYTTVDFKRSQSYFMCNTLCDYRNNC